eukprot:COSAG01_NODE_333_length_18717_cov_40.372072_16_plen_39_part_00
MLVVQYEDTVQLYGSAAGGGARARARAEPFQAARVAHE